MPSISNLVQQLSASTGTGNIVMSAQSGRQSFSAAFGTGGTDMFFYFISHQSAAEWEVGTGHLFDAVTLVRDTVISSSNANALVNFSAGNKDVVNDISASRQLVLPDAPASGDILHHNGTDWTRLARGSNGQFLSSTAASVSWASLGVLASKSSIDLSGAEATGILAAGRFPALTGDVTTAAGALSSTIPADTVTNAKLANMPANTIKGNNTGSAADPVDLTATQVSAVLGLGTLAAQNGTFSGTSSGTNTGDQTITLTGDVTGTGAGSFAATVANDAVTFAKMQNIATDSLIGRDTAATGDPENIALNATLEMDGAGALRRAALTGDVTATAGSNATTIANGAVSFVKQANMSTNRLVGRSTAGAGSPEEIAVGAGLSLSAGTLSATGGGGGGVSIGAILALSQSNFI